MAEYPTITDEELRMRLIEAASRAVSGLDVEKVARAWYKFVKEPTG